MTTLLEFFTTHNWERGDFKQFKDGQFCYCILGAILELKIDKYKKQDQVAKAVEDYTGKVTFISEFNDKLESKSELMNFLKKYNL